MNTRRGTTILELIVALVITATVAAMGARTFQQVIDRRTTVVEATRDAERAASLRALLREWLVLGAIDLANTNVATNDELHFTTTALTPARSASPRVRLYVDQNDETPERGLAIEFQRTLSMPIDRRQLDADITGLRVELLDRTTRRWVAIRDGVSAAPLAVRLHLEVGNDRNTPLWQLPLTVALDSTMTRTGALP